MSLEERIFNHRLSRARRIAENAFGRLAPRWRCLLTTMQQQPETVKVIVSACLCLHNPGLQKRDLDREGNDHRVILGAWRNDAVLPVVKNVQGRNRATREAKAVRVYIKHY